MQELYERALKEGILKKNMTGYKKSLSKLANKGTMDFYSFAILYSAYIPRFIYKLFTYKPIFRILNSRIFNHFFDFMNSFGIQVNKMLHISKNVINR